MLMKQSSNRGRCCCLIGCQLNCLGTATFHMRKRRSPEAPGRTFGSPFSWQRNLQGLMSHFGRALLRSSRSLFTVALFLAVRITQCQLKAYLLKHIWTSCRLLLVSCSISRLHQQIKKGFQAAIK
jgi:hypothetical protein